MMKSLLAFLAIFSLLLLYNTVDGRKHPEEYLTRGRNLRMLVPMRKATEQKPKVILSIDEFKYHNADTDAEDEAEEKPLGTSSEPVGSGGEGGGDPKEEEPLGTSSEPVGSGGEGGGDPKEEEPLGTSSEPVGSGGEGGGDPKEEEPLGTSSEPVGSGGEGGGDPKEEEPLGTSSEPVGSGGGDPKVHKHLFKQYGPKVPAN